MSRALARHLAHARDPSYVFEPRDVIGMRKLLNDWAPSGVDWQPHRYKPAQLIASDRDKGYDLASTREAQCLQLLDTLASIPHAISPEFTAKGLKWFNAMHRYRKQGTGHASIEWRNTAMTRCFDARKRAIVDGFERFEFVGFTNRGTNWYVPIYRVHGVTPRMYPETDHFDYAYGSWQSGQGVYFPRDPVHVEPGKVYQLDVSKCPNVIMVPEHYRNDGTCLCDDPNAKIMRTWGYKWNKAKGVWS